MGELEPLTTPNLGAIAERLLAERHRSNPNLPPPAECKALIEAASTSEVCEGHEASRLARGLLGCFRKTDYTDNEVFATALAATFAEYPRAIGRQVCDPVRGLPSRCKFPPSLAEVSQAIENAMDRRRAIIREAEWALQEHARLAAIPDMMEAARRTAEERAETWRRLQHDIEATRPEGLDALQVHVRQQWEHGMCLRLVDRPHLAAEYLGFLRADPALGDLASRAERSSRGAGWPKLSVELLKLHEAGANGQASA